MKDIYELIRNFNNDKNVIELNNYYNSVSFMEILRVTRDERSHSSFLAWLFDSSVNYDLKTKPLMLLLDLLIKADDKNNFPEDNKKDITLRKAKIISKEIDREHSIKHAGFVDIYIEFDIEGLNERNKYAIVIENKVEAKENKEPTEDGKILYQTTKYYNYFNNDETNTKYIFAFLSPTYNEEKVPAEDAHFINISYDEILNNIINPILRDNNILPKTRMILEDYIKALSKPNIIDPDNNTFSLATSEYETRLINNIKTKHIELGELLFKDDATEILKEFIQNNNLIIAVAWPEVIRKRNKNRSFAELGIKPGSILYLSKSEGSNIRDNENIYVETIDELSQVKYITKDGEAIIQNISTMAKILKVPYRTNGFLWFIYNNGTEDINLSKIPRKC